MKCSFLTNLINNHMNRQITTCKNIDMETCFCKLKEDTPCVFSNLHLCENFIPKTETLSRNTKLYQFLKILIAIAFFCIYMFTILFTASAININMTNTLLLTISPVSVFSYLQSRYIVNKYIIG